MTSIQQRSKDLSMKIFTRAYYVHLYLEVLTKSGIQPSAIEKCELDDQKLIKMWNAFWLKLPDSPQIRRDPFFDLCDICEEIFADQE